MISTERLLSYGKLAPEATLETPLGVKKPDRAWPHYGSLRLQNLSFRYGKDVPYVLKGITVNIIPSEKVQVSIYVEVQYQLICTCILYVDNMQLSIFIIINTSLPKYMCWCMCVYSLVAIQYIPETNRQKNVPQGLAYNFQSVSAPELWLG